jgi:uncharacterized cupredoxin-like copper-binding protein
MKTRQSLARIWLAPVWAARPSLFMLLHFLTSLALVGGMAAATSPPEWAAFGAPDLAGAPARTIALQATDMKFAPDDLRIRTGETIRFVVTNRGAVEHEFVIGDRAFQDRHMREMERMPDMKMDEANALDLAPGQTKTLLWHFTRPGELTFACDIPGHAHAGMVGKLHIR